VEGSGIKISSPSYSSSRDSSESTSSIQSPTSEAVGSYTIGIKTYCRMTCDDLCPPIVIDPCVALFVANSASNISINEQKAIHGVSGCDL
jgi:hypothetical protein